MLRSLADTTSLNQMMKSSITSNGTYQTYVSPDTMKGEKNQGHLCDVLPKLHNFNLIIRKHNNPN